MFSVGLEVSGRYFGTNVIQALVGLWFQDSKYRDICFTPWRALRANGVWCPPALITALPDRRRVGDTEQAPIESTMELLSRVRHRIKPHFLALLLGLIDVGVMLPAWNTTEAGFFHLGRGVMMKRFVRGKKKRRTSWVFLLLLRRIKVSVCIGDRWKASLWPAVSSWG